MSIRQALTIEADPWTVLVSLAAVVSAAVLGWLAWKRSGYRRAIGCLELLRWVLVALAVVLLNQPEWMQQYMPSERPTLVVLHDDSGSMQTEDVVGPSGQRGSRAAALAPLLDRATWEEFESRMDVVFQPFAAEEHDEGTDLGGAIAAALDRHPSLLGLVVASDGDWNIGMPPAEAAGRARARKLPIFTIPVGSTERLPDVEILSFDVPSFGVAGKAVRIPLALSSSLPRDYSTTLTLKIANRMLEKGADPLKTSDRPAGTNPLIQQTANGQQFTHEVTIPAMGRVSDAITWQPDEAGEYTLTLTVPAHPSEVVLENNAREAPISIREERLRVLVVESYPRWEYRYLRNALSRDPGVQLSCLLFQPGLSKVGGGNADYVSAFPAGPDELSAFDVIFLGDVGVGTGQLTQQQCEWLKGLVAHQASGLIFLPGWQGRQFSLLETELADLYPVTMDAGQVDGWGSRTPAHFELTQLGQRSLLTKLADTEQENAEVWEGLPGFQWYAPVVKSRPGSDVLAVHKDVSNEFGRLPLLVTRTFGNGKVLFMGTDGAWRWRKGVEDLYHYRFWSQVVRWMAYQRNMARGESMRLYYSPEQPRVRQTVVLTANVMEASGEPLGTGDVTARIVGGSGRGQTLRLQSRDDAWGEFAGRWTPQEPGRHELVMTCSQTGDQLESSIYVQGDALEQVGKPSRPEVLEEIARISRGKMLPLENLNLLSDMLRVLPDPQPDVRRIPLWSSPYVAGLMIFLLSVFWVCRKTVGLI